MMAEPKKLLDANGITMNIRWKSAVPMNTFGMPALFTVAPPTRRDAAA